MLLQRVEPERTLTDPQRDEFEDMLRSLTLERSQIKEAMGFALDNADAAGEVNLLFQLNKQKVMVGPALDFLFVTVHIAYQLT